MFFIIFWESSSSTLTFISSFPFHSLPILEWQFRIFELLATSSSELEDSEVVALDLLLELDSKVELYFRLLRWCFLPFSDCLSDFRRDCAEFS